MRGFKEKTDDRCEYQFIDRTYCKRHISEKYPDINGKHYCIMHSRNDDKLVHFSKEIYRIIERKNKLFDKKVKKVDEEYDEFNLNIIDYLLRSFELSRKEKKKAKHIGKIYGDYNDKILYPRNQENIPRDTLINLEGFYFPDKFHLENIDIYPEVCLLYSKFGNDISINDITFKNKIDFSESNFNGSIFFNDLFFEKNPNFNKCKFNITYFVNCIFFNGVSFDNTIFKNISNFESSYFIERSEFHRIQMDNLRFLNCYVYGLSLFNSNFSGSIFSNCDWDEYSALKKIEKIALSAYDIVKIRNNSSISDLRAFADSIYKVFNRTAIQFAKAYLVLDRRRQFVRRISVRQIIIDEFLIIFEEDDIQDSLGNIKNTYIQLKASMDKSGDYDLANDFYYGEMEAKRKISWEKFRFDSKKKISSSRFINSDNTILKFLGHIFFYIPIVFFFSLINIKNLLKSLFFLTYKLLSGYGNRPILSIFSSVFLLILFSFMCVIPGEIIRRDLKSGNSTLIYLNTAKEKIEMGFTLTLSNISTGTTFNQFAYNSNHLLLNSFLFFIQYIFRPVMITLIVLAIRRKVRRN